MREFISAGANLCQPAVCEDDCEDVWGVYEGVLWLREGVRVRVCVG